MTPPTPNRPHPGVFPQDLVWNDEPRAMPAPVSSSDVSDYEREAELLAGLAQRSYQLRQEHYNPPERAEYPDDELDRRMTWQDLYDMFVIGKVSKRKASDWADRIVERGVRRR